MAAALGRPRSASRRDQIRCVSLVVRGFLSVAEAARAFGVTPRTVGRWQAELLDDDGEDGRLMRSIACPG